MSDVCISLLIIYSPDIIDKSFNGNSLFVSVGSTPTSNTPEYDKFSI